MTFDSKKLIAVVLGICIVLSASQAMAQTKKAFRKEAKEYAAQLRAAGEPSDRCSIGIMFSADGTVVRNLGVSDLQAGDKLLGVDGTPLSQDDLMEQFLAHVRGLEPEGQLTVRIDRAGDQTDVPISCVNARARQELILTVLDKVAKKKFDDCVALLEDHPSEESFIARLKRNCAGYSKKSERYDLGQLTYDWLKLSLEDAIWLPDQREEAIRNLIRSEPFIMSNMGNARFQQLVSLTRQWDGDEDAYETTRPDWNTFRLNAEAALVRRLIDPDSARIEWPYGFQHGYWKPFMQSRLEGYWTCGLINARNRMGGYTGSTFFVVVLNDFGQVLYADIGQNQDYDLLEAQCNNSVQYLSAAPPDMFAPKEPVAPPAAAPSLADEIKALSELRDSGIITEEEFEQAKKKVLEGGH